MTLGHKATISGEGDGMCTCGLARQDIPHLLFACPLLPEPGLAIRSLEELPPSINSALILPSDANDQLIYAWKEACARTISVLSNPNCNVGPVRDPLNWKGHVPVLTVEGTYVFCSLCFISRFQDQKFLCVHPCKPLLDIPAKEGDYIMVGEHIMRVQVVKWKKYCRRPLLICQRCHHRCWATSLERTSRVCALDTVPH